MLEHVKRSCDNSRLLRDGSRYPVHCCIAAEYPALSDGWLVVDGPFKCFNRFRLDCGFWQYVTGSYCPWEKWHRKQWLWMTYYYMLFHKKRTPFSCTGIVTADGTPRCSPARRLGKLQWEFRKNYDADSHSRGPWLHQGVSNLSTGNLREPPCQGEKRSLHLHVLQVM